LARNAPKVFGSMPKAQVTNFIWLFDVASGIQEVV
jgi:hypothetical protein